ncbi:hypothetical protein R3P38DRAFT_3244640 [Favolaschia claudopus]|uniref:Ribonuclease H1 N-terminal domain-containing protein n=1 Tax=Favolaschia claudopus TaxID=2862362 RepID=A0AAV9Z1H8_9AGAR
MKIHPKTISPDLPHGPVTARSAREHPTTAENTLLPASLRLKALPVFLPSNAPSPLSLRCPGLSSFPLCLGRANIPFSSFVHARTARSDGEKLHGITPIRQSPALHARPPTWTPHSVYPSIFKASTELLLHSRLRCDSEETREIILAPPKKTKCIADPSSSRPTTFPRRRPSVSPGLDCHLRHGTTSPGTNNEDPNSDLQKSRVPAFGRNCTAQRYHPHHSETPFSIQIFPLWNDEPLVHLASPHSKPARFIPKPKFCRTTVKYSSPSLNQLPTALSGPTTLPEVAGPAASSSHPFKLCLLCRTLDSGAIRYRRHSAIRQSSFPDPYRSLRSYQPLSSSPLPLRIQPPPNPPMSSSSAVDTRALALQRARDIADAIPDLTAADLRSLLRHIADDRLREVVQMVGVAALAAQLDPAFAKLLRATTGRGSSAHATSTTQPKAEPQSPVLDATTAPEPHRPPPAARKGKAKAAEAKIAPPDAHRAPPAARKGKSKAAEEPDSEPVPLVLIPDSPPPKPTKLPLSSPTPYTFPAVPVKSQPLSSSSPASGRYHYHTPYESGYTDDWLEASAMKNRFPGSSVYKTGSRPDSKTYLVLLGAPEVGLFDSSQALQDVVENNPRVLWVSFPTRADARAAWEFARARGWTGDSNPLTLPAPTSKFPLALDAATHPSSPLVSGMDWYVVTYGANPGVYASYLEAQLNCWELPGRCLKKYSSRALAEAAYGRAMAKGWIGVLTRSE